ncbi:MAG: hypothetical protein P9L90_04635 [Candidatus Aadella gelida]|nr:hypothetical protein [Candidatus Aadella gelida]
MIRKIFLVVLMGLMCAYAYADGIEGDYISEEGVRNENQDLWDGDYISREGQRSGDAVLKNNPAEDKDKVIDKRGEVLSSDNEKKVYDEAGVLVSEPDLKKEEENDVDGSK